MEATILAGVLVSFAAELVNWLNQKLSNTFLAGRAAFLLAFVVSIIGASVKVAWFTPGVVFSWSTLWVAFSQIWAVSQVFFVFVVSFLGIDVKPAASSRVIGQ